MTSIRNIRDQKPLVPLLEHRVGCTVGDRPADSLLL